MTEEHLRELKWLSPAAKTRAGEMIVAGEKAARIAGVKAPEGELDAFLFAIGRSRGQALMIVDSVATALDAAGDLAPKRDDGALETDKSRTYAERIAMLVKAARGSARRRRRGALIREAIKVYAGCWRSCSGCYETDEGYDTAPRDPDFGVPLGGGCSECGGIGAVWDTTDYAALGDVLAIEPEKADDENAAYCRDRAVRRTLYACAVHHQGNGSGIGTRLAVQLGLSFPLRMDRLRAAAVRERFNPQTLWPWMEDWE